MKTILPFILLFSLLLSCAPKSIIGLYKTDATGKILMAGYNYQFFADSTFKMNFWSDDISGNREGIGTYQITGNQLKLQYEAFPAPMASYEWYPLEEMDNGKTYYQFTAKDIDEQLLVGLTIQLLDKNDQPLAQGATDMDGKYKATITKAVPAQTIALSYLGMAPINIELTDRMSSGFNVIMVPKSNYIPAGTIEELRFKNTAKYLKLDDGKREWQVVRQ